MYTAQACASSAVSYDFQRDFSGIARPGMNRYLRRLGYDPDAPADGLDDCWRAGLDYLRELRRVLDSNQRQYYDYGHAWDLEIYGFADWTRESVAAYVEARLSDQLDTDEAPPVDLYKAVYLGTELARERGLDVGPEAIAYAADRLKSKIERDVVCDGETEVLDGFQSYAFLKETRRRRLELTGHAPGGAEIVYLDVYKRQRERAAEERQAKQEQPRQEKRRAPVLPIITALELKTKDVGKPEFIVEGWIQNSACRSPAGRGRRRQVVSTAHAGNRGRNGRRLAQHAGSEGASDDLHGRRGGP